MLPFIDSLPIVVPTLICWSLGLTVIPEEPVGSRQTLRPDSQAQHLGTFTAETCLSFDLVKRVLCVCFRVGHLL